MKRHVLLLVPLLLAALAGLGTSVAAPVRSGGSATVAPADDPGQVVVARADGTFAGGMFMPTSVAVGPGGDVFVADGVKNRVLRFGADGKRKQELERVAGKALAHPAAVATSADGRLWIADTGNRRLVVVAADGSGQAVSLPEKWSGGADLTGVAVTPNGDTIWLVDNDNHRLLRGDTGSGRWTAVGKYGMGRAQLRYPFQAAATEDGGVFTTDVLNGRVQAFNRGGRPEATVGRYGVTAGRLHRPTGVAVGEGLVWVADASLGVVQVFTPGGRLVDVVRGPGGGLLRLQHPAGLAVADGHLYVVELEAHRVRRFALSREPGKARSVGAVRQGTTDLSADECTVCHLEAVADLVDANPAALIKRPSNSPDDPYVARSGACLSCHIGTVLDSRAEVWKGHGHPAGALDGLQTELPLVDGGMSCRTCHTAHSLAGSGQQHRGALMMRVERDPEELCTGCHTDHHAEGAHPVGAIEAGLQGIAADVTAVGCLDCHAAHGAESKPMLARGAQEATCDGCHTRVDRKGAGHPVKLDRGAVKALTSRGLAMLGPGSTVACASCHDVHRKDAPDRTCATCHSDGPPDDPRHEGPQHSGVACGECHPVHDGVGIDLSRQASEGDPQGCLSCHGEGGEQQAVDSQPGRLGHSLVADAQDEDDASALQGCPSCHEAHDPVAAGRPLCASCHEEQHEELGDDGHGTATCRDCHPAHDDSPALAEAQHAGLNPVSRRCLACHDEAAEGGLAEAPRVAEFEHPSDAFDGEGARPEALAGLALFDAAGKLRPPGEVGAMTCATCHLTHGPDRERPRTKRRTSGVPEACAACHGKSALPFYLYFHEPERRASHNGK